MKKDSKTLFNDILCREDTVIKISPTVSAGTQSSGSNKNKAFCFNLFARRKATGKAGIIPELLLFDTQHWKRPEERRQAAVKELTEKQAILEQRRK